MRYFLIMAAVCGLSSSVMAATPDWKGYAGLADKDGDGYPAFVGTATAASTGYNGAVDCDDAHKSMNPGLTEVPDDGIDQDCNGSDLKLPVSKAEYARFAASGNASRGAVVFVKEYDRCAAATNRCSVDAVDGKFKITDPEKDAFRDIYTGTGKVLGTDGVREVITLEEASHFRGGGSGGGGSTGVSPKTVKKVAAEAVKVETDARLKWQAELEEGIITPITNAVNGHGKAIDDNARAISDVSVWLDRERDARKNADERLENGVAAAMSKAQDASNTANWAAGHGPLIEAYAATGLVVGSPVAGAGDDNARDAFGGGAGAGLNFGAEVNSVRVNGFVDAIVGYDGGAGIAHSETVGAEVVGDDGVGGFLAYSSRSTQVNSLQTQIVGRSPIAGLSVVLPFAQGDAGGHGILLARVGCGPEFIGIATSSVSDWVSLGCRATVGIGGGVGSLL
ncbi:putative metal-binding motif-containing protein [Candidatus Uhrbacteria bacterium]|nr:putative metal-binding motif-containing protein [Candidatus Uhrbacteria bacterium]